MTWHVIYHDSNRREITTVNIFKHYGFRRDVINAANKCSDFTSFSKEVGAALQDHFWSKCEWEIQITPWVGRADPVKIDVYDQVMLNWEAFIDYVWNNRTSLVVSSIPAQR